MRFGRFNVFPRAARSVATVNYGLISGDCPTEESLAGRELIDGETTAPVYVGSNEFYSY